MKEGLFTRFLLRVEKTLEEDIARQVFLGNLLPEQAPNQVFVSFSFSEEDLSATVSLDWESVPLAPQASAKYPEVPRPETGLFVAHSGPTDSLTVAELHSVFRDHQGSIESALASLQDATTPEDTHAALGEIVAACVVRAAQERGTLDGAVRAFLMESAYEVRIKK